MKLTSHAGSMAFKAMETEQIRRRPGGERNPALPEISEEQTGQPGSQSGEEIEEEHQQHHGQKIGNDMTEDPGHGHIPGCRTDGEHVDAYRRGNLPHFHKNHADHAEPYAVKAYGFDTGINGGQSEQYHGNDVHHAAEDDIGDDNGHETW